MKTFVNKITYSVYLRIYIFTLRDREFTHFTGPLCSLNWENYLKETLTVYHSCGHKHLRGTKKQLIKCDETIMESVVSRLHGHSSRYSFYFCCNWHTILVQYFWFYYQVLYTWRAYMQTSRLQDRRHHKSLCSQLPFCSNRGVDLSAAQSWEQKGFIQPGDC